MSHNFLRLNRTLEQYLRDHAHLNADFVVSAATEPQSDGVFFGIRPLNVDGETLDFKVKGNGLEAITYVAANDTTYQPYYAQHFNDRAGNPAGGFSQARGISISWQNGPLEGNEPTGALVETVIAIARDRLNFYQQSQFACSFNAEAIDCLNDALAALLSRTSDRLTRGVEGTNQV